MTVDKK
jgi:hypothetical protein